MPTLANPPSQYAVRPRRRKRNGLLVSLFVLFALLGLIVYPPTFLFAVRQALGFEAWRYGFQLSIGSMDGSVTDPIWLYNARLSHNSTAGTSTMIEIDSARTSFAWKHVVWQRDSRVWNDLTLDGVRGSIDLPTASQSFAKSTPSPFHRHISSKPPRLLLPSSLTIHRAGIVIRERGGFIRLDDIDLQASDIAAGQLVIGAISVHSPWMTSVFSNCRGSLTLKDSKLELANMKITDALSISSASADLPELLRGQLQMEFGLDAFSGNIQGELSSGAHEQHLVFDSSGTFSNISVAQLAAFFGDDADGSIKQGKFNFHGSPRDLARATFTTFFEAGNFRWGARRWNSLIAGATYVHHRLTNLDFELRQAHNSLSLNGNMSVPESWNEWWKTDFGFVVAARIDNLAELSALLGPAFGDISGRLTIDGSVRGENSAFNGQLIASGSHLSFRKAPLDQLQAAVKLDGNELQVTNAEFTHGDDFFRAHGVVNILGEKRYWGEVKASIADLSLYDSFLRPPIAPVAFGGGLMLDWSGDGVPSAQSGAFSVRLNHLHPLVSTSGAAPSWQPIDLSADGTYSPDSIFFSNFVLGNGDTTLASRVVATPVSLTLQNLKVLHGETVWLAGSAQVPLNVWAAWQDPDAAALWNYGSPCKLDLTFNRLSIHDTLLLSGRPQPFDGELNGNLKSDGTLAKLTTDGHLVIKNAGGVVPAGTLKGANAFLDLKGNQLTLTSGTGNWNGLSWTASGTIAGSDVRTPTLDLAIALPAAPLPLANGMNATAALDLRATGQPDTLALSGTAQLQSLTINTSADIEGLIAPGGIGLRDSLPSLTISGPPSWKLDFRVQGDTAVQLANTTGEAMPSLQVSGSLAQPILSGSIDVKGFSMTQGPNELSIVGGTFFLSPATPAFVMHAAGSAGADIFDGYVFGSLAEKHFTWSPDITAALAGHADLVAMPALPTQTLSLEAPTPQLAAFGAVPLILDSPAFPAAGTP